MSFNPKNSGFTVIEILSVLAIFAIAGAVGIPSWSYFSASAELRAAKDNLKRDLYSIQQSAAAEQYSHIIRLYPESNSYKTLKILVDENNPLSTEEIEIGEFFLGKGIDLENSTFENNQIEFFPFGNPSCGGQIVLKNQRGEEISIEISPAGIIN